jgi:bifunctional UDP-N-acetylglucosamine pyrophosphorylase/glucosamine-1-phosphate N-acetyltransferase
VVIGPGVSIADGAVIHSFSHIVQSSIGKKAQVGPYARMRPAPRSATAPNRQFRRDQGRDPGSRRQGQPSLLYRRCHRGHQFQHRRRRHHCNYDGFSKHKTTIGTGAFVGTNCSLVAPVNIGNGAYIGSGSVITRDVPDDALAVERSPQNNREGGAKRYRELKTRKKQPKEG